MVLTEQVAAGEEIALPEVRQSPPSMTSQMNTECREQVKERYRSRFSLAAQSHIPEPVYEPTDAALVAPSTSEVSEGPSTSAALEGPSRSVVVSKRRKLSKQ